jgi:CheY-like chemotaxis protein
LARKILLADDSVTAQNMGRKILADAGYDVITVNNGSAALKRIAEVKPDLIVLDVYMPGYSGLEVCQRLKDSDETAHVPVLLTVGKLEPFKPEEARRVRADGHIIKPFEASELLTAITRLEDRMVPQQSDGGRFASSVSGVERFGGDGTGWRTESRPETDSGWKTRLRFPSKKKQEEPEPEADEAAIGATFRDFRKAKGKTSASGVFAVKPPAPVGQEPGLVPEIPRDITPEELDALSALAAKLDGPIPAAENIAPLAEEMRPVEAPVAEAAAAKAEVEVPAAPPEQEQGQEEEEHEFETLPPVIEVEPARAAVEAPESAVAAPELTAEEKSDIEITVEHTEPASEHAAVDSAPPSLETPQQQAESPEMPAAVAEVSVNSAVLAQEPAPVDRDDEPAFASTASAIEPPQEEKEEEIAGAPDAVATSEADVPAEAVAAKGRESKPVELNQEDSHAEEPEEDAAEELRAERSRQATAFPTSAPEAAETEEPTPSAEQLAEALSLLTPAIAHADVSIATSHPVQSSAREFLADEAPRYAPSGSQWMAEAVALSPEEAAISLEAEMFGTPVAKSAAMSKAMTEAMSETASGGEIEPERVTVVSAIAAAVENRLAEAEVEASAKALAEQGRESAAETSDEENPAVVLAAVSNAASSLVAGIDLGKPEPGKVEAAKIKAEKLEAPEHDTPVQVAEEASAVAVTRNEVEAAAEQNEEPVRGTAAAVATASTAEENQGPSSEVGGQESMGNESKDKSAKSSWRQIRNVPANAPAARDVAEAKQHADPEVAESVKAMAAAAAEGAASASATEASEIASIVDSMLAELKPKLMQEIAKKLAKK